jgi:hypothetical protein
MNLQVFSVAGPGIEPDLRDYEPHVQPYTIPREVPIVTFFLRKYSRLKFVVQSGLMKCSRIEPKFVGDGVDDGGAKVKPQSLICSKGANA